MHLLYQKNVEEQWFLTTASGATSKCSQGIHEVIPRNIIFIYIYTSYPHQLHYYITK